MIDLQCNFKATVYLWQAKNSDKVDKSQWYFINLPQEFSQQIKFFLSQGMGRAFASVKVEAKIGETSWRTSIFKSNEQNTYILPLKKTVRQSENIGAQDEVEVSLNVIT